MKSVWIVLLTVLVTGSLVGGGTYYYLNNKSESDRKDLQTQIDDLNTSLTQKQLEISKITAENQAAPAAETSANPTAGWKTYSYKNYGLNFKYPTDWKLDESEHNSSLWSMNEKARASAISEECFSGGASGGAIAGCNQFATYVYKNGVMEQVLNNYKIGKKDSEVKIAGKTWTKLLIEKDPSNRRYYDYVLYHTTIGENTLVVEHTVDTTGTIDNILKNITLTI